MASCVYKTCDGREYHTLAAANSHEQNLFRQWLKTDPAVPAIVLEALTTEHSGDALFKYFLGIQGQPEPEPVEVCTECGDRDIYRYENDEPFCSECYCIFFGRAGF